METIEIKDLGNYLVNGFVDKAFSIRPDKDSTDVKNLTGRIHFQNTSLADVVAKACSPTIITFANGPGRSKFDQWTDRQTIDINFKAPATRVKTREESIAELVMAFQKAGLPEDKAVELATKSVDNPEIIT